MRSRVEAAEALLDKVFPVLDHGHVILTDYMGSDDDIANAARVSNAGQVEKKSSNKGLIRYLLRHHHTSPFEMVEFKFICRMPIFVARQWIRHRTACLAGDAPISFDLPGGKTKSSLPRHYSLTVKQIYDRWQETRNVSRPKRQENPLYKRERVQGMRLRCLNTNTMEICHTQIEDIVLSGTKKVLKVVFDDGSVLRATEDHKCFTSLGWLQLKTAIRRKAKFVGVGKCRVQKKVAQSFSPAELSREQWETIPGFPYNYEVSSLGRVRNWHNTRGVMLDTPIIKSQTLVGGYPSVSLSQKGKSRLHRVHKLVLFAFVGGRPRGAQARHGDDCPENCRLSNLSWGSAQDNSDDRMSHGCDQSLSARWVSVDSWKEDGVEDVFDIEVKGPWHNFVAGGVVVHNSVNEASGRYSVLPNEFYVPSKDQICAQSKGNNQGRSLNSLSEETANTIIRLLKIDAEEAFRRYHMFLGDNPNLYFANDAIQREIVESGGLARELARINLPLSTYTEWVWKIDLHNLLRFLSLRMDEHAQWEIQQYAGVLFNIVSAVCPIATEAFQDYMLNAITFSKHELQALAKVFHFGADIGNLSSLKEEVAATVPKFSSREVDEFLAKIAQIQKYL